MLPQINKVWFKICIQLHVLKYDHHNEILTN